VIALEVDDIQKTADYLATGTAGQIAGVATPAPGDGPGTLDPSSVEGEF
jgi:hypothetical protein